MSKDQFIYLYARNNQRFRYDIKAQAFSTCKPAKRSFINSICHKQWGQWQVIDSYLYTSLIARLKEELLSLEGKATYSLNHW